MFKNVNLLEKIEIVYFSRILFSHLEEKIKLKLIKYNKNLVFEGEYLNGERNGKGKEYDYFRKLKFEGEYLNGKRWNGISRIYYFNGALLMELE